MDRINSLVATNADKYFDKLWGTTDSVWVWDNSIICLNYKI